MNQKVIHEKHDLNYFSTPGYTLSHPTIQYIQNTVALLLVLALSHFDSNEKGEKMSGMGDGYVGTAQDAVRIQKLEKQREAERRKIQELKDKSASSNDQPGLLQFGKSQAEVRFPIP